jgi:hypothetical protein
MTVIRRTTPLGELMSLRHVIDRISDVTSARAEKPAHNDDRGVASAAEMSDGRDARSVERGPITEPGN